jgi:putative endonuclease
MNGQKPFWAYIVANRKNGAIYAGHTDNLPVRIWQHRNKTFKGFASRYGCNQLVWCEAFDTREEAFLRERQIKDWRRSWKVQLIERTNPDWLDLADTINMWS